MQVIISQPKQELNQVESTQPSQINIQLNANKENDEFIFSPDFLRILNMLSFVRWCLKLANRFSIPKPKPEGTFQGREQLYTDEQVMLTAIVMRVWRISMGEVIRRLSRWQKLQEACTFQPGQIISKSRFSRRLRQLGLLPYFFLMISLVYELARRGVIVGKELILDSTTLIAWYKEDFDALYSFCGKFGFKVHTVICRFSMMPLWFILTPANRNDAPVAIPLLKVVMKLYPFFKIERVYADAAYFTKDIVWFIGKVLSAIAFIDYNLRRKGKKAVATLEFLSFWNTEVLGKRSTIERFFGIVKRYYGLNDFQVQGLQAVILHVLLTYIAVLSVAMLAVSIGRKDLIRSPRRILAPC